MKTAIFGIISLGGMSADAEEHQKEKRPRPQTAKQMSSIFVAYIGNFANPLKIGMFRKIFRVYASAYSKKPMIHARGPQTKLNGNRARHTIGSWARYLGSGTQAQGKSAGGSLRGKLDQIWGTIVGTLGWRNRPEDKWEPLLS